MDVQVITHPRPRRPGTPPRRPRRRRRRLGDEARLHQVIANLLTNARVHTPPGTRVTAVVEARDDNCVVRVRDNGPGIPPELLPTVFERFTRADLSRTRTGGPEVGSGLGLAIVAAITGAHGGRIEVDSAPGHTEFTIELPTRVHESGRRISVELAPGV